MMRKFVNRITDNIYRDRVALIIACALTLLNVALIFIFDLEYASFEYSKISVAYAILSGSAIAIHVVLCIVLRLKRKTQILKGIFYYQFVGAFAFFVCFIGFMTSKSFWFFENVYSWWSILYQPLTVVLCRIIQIKMRFILGMIYLLLTIITGNSILGIRKDIAFYKRVEEDKLHI